MDYNDLVRTAGKVIADTHWFNGSSESIFTRLDRLQELLDGTRMAASSDSVNVNDLEKLASIITELQEERGQLEKIASEYTDFDAEDYLNSLPGGTIAREYRVSSAGTADLGEDDGSLLFRTASNIESEYQNADWINFVTAGAEMWIEDQNNRLLESQSATREAATYYVEGKTMPILDVVKRATIIDNFIDNVELCRRAKKDNLESKRASSDNKLRLASRLNEDAINDSFGDSLNWF
jgi:hypothetical protein